MKTSPLHFPRFLVIEGPDGSGKTTQLEMLRDFLVRKGQTVIVAREPGGTKVGEGIRTLFKENFGDTHPMTEALMMLAARNQLYCEVIHPALYEQQTWVLTDRHHPSMYAYQGAGHQLGFGVLNDLRAGMGDMDVTAHGTVILSVSAEERERRMDERGGRDAIDDADLDFRKRVAEAYHEIINGNWHLKLGILHDVNGQGTAQEVHERILDAFYCDLKHLEDVAA